MRTRQHIAMLIACSLWLWLDAPVSDATELVREEPIPIRSIIADPQAFHLRAVRLQGIIQTLERLPRRSDCRQYDSNHFILDDQTGRLTINDFEACSSGGSVQPLMTGFTVGESIEVIIILSVLPSPNFDSHSLEARLRWVKRISKLAGDGSHPSR